MKKIKGIVIQKIQGFYYVACNDKVYECKLKGIIKRYNNKENCIVGDNVKIDDNFVITDILPRKNYVVRPLVANIDNLFIIFSGKNPKFDCEKLQILLLNSFFYKVHPILIITKIDLLDDNEFAELKNNLKFLDILKISYYFKAKNDLQILDKIKNIMKNKLNAFCGMSGVGKSTLSNIIVGENIMEIGEISQKLKRGKHTTKEIKLLKLPFGGYLTDSPGFLSIELPNIKNCQELQDLFYDFNNYKTCKYVNCKHINEPNCGIKEALNHNKIFQIRYAFYKKILSKYENERWNKYEK